MAQAKQDMGTGSIKKLMLQLMIPAVVAQVVNLLYNIVDRIYIGHIAGIGAAALTGVGLFTPILMLLNAFAMLVGAGGAPRTAIALGQGDKKQAEKIVSNSFTVLMFFAVVLTIGFYAGAPVLLRLFGASDATLPYALSYSRIYIAGSVFVLVVLGMNPFITTQGFAKTSMLTTVIGAVINIILDPILIFGFGLGVRGAAIATVIATFCGLAGHVTYAFVTRQPFLGFAGELFRWPSTFLRPIFRRMIPMAGNEIVFGLGDAMYLKAFGMLGTAMLEAYQVAYKIGMVPHTIADGMGSASGILLGEHLGRGESEKARSIIRYLFPLAIGLSVVVSAVMILIARPVVSIFALPDSSVDVAVLMVRLFNIRIATRMFNAVLLSAIRAGGDTKFLLFMDSGLVWLVGIPAAYIGLLVLGVNSLPVLFLLTQSEQVVRMIIGLLRCRSGKWLHNLTEETGTQ